MQSTIVTIDQNGIVLSVDKNFCKLFGFTLEELIGNSINIIIPPPYADRHDSFLRDYAETGVPKIVGKSRFVEAAHKDGSTFPIRLAVSQIGEAPDTVFIGVIDKLQDLTGTITINSIGIMVACNQNTEDLFGYKSNEMVGRNISLLMPEPYRSHHDQYIREYVAGGSPKAIGSVRNFLAQGKDGIPFPVCIRVEELRVGDIRLFRSRIDKVDRMEAVFTLSDDGTILSSNEQHVLALFGYEKQELVGLNMSVLVPAMNSNSKLNASDSFSERTIVVERDEEDPATTFEEAFRSEKRQKTTHEEWNSPGVHYFSVRHKDGSNFPAIFEIYPLLNHDIYSSPLSDKSGSFFRRGGPLVVEPAPLAVEPAPPVFLKSSSLSTLEGKPTFARSSYNSPVKTHSSCPSSPLTRSPILQGKIPKFCVNIKRADQPSMPPPPETAPRRLIGDYDVVRTIGQGTYGKVKLAKHRRTNEIVAIKILLKSHMKTAEVERVQREIEILRNLHHPNVAKLLEVIETEKAINIVMEYAGRTLSAMTDGGPLTEASSRKIFGQIASAVQYCHHSKIIHRDLKHQNILLDDLDQPKLIDFGLSNFMEEGKMRNTFCGTPAYAAPEMILGKQYTGPEVDIWSLGIILYSCVAGSLPFDNVADIIRGYWNPPKVSNECMDLLNKMLHINAEERCTIDDILQHPWSLETSVDKTGDQISSEPISPRTVEIPPI